MKKTFWVLTIPNQHYSLLLNTHIFFYFYPPSSLNAVAAQQYCPSFKFSYISYFILFHMLFLDVSQLLLCRIEDFVTKDGKDIISSDQLIPQIINTKHLHLYPGQSYSCILCLMIMSNEMIYIIIFIIFNKYQIC